MAEILMYGTRSCGDCERAERLLEAKGVSAIRKVLVDTDPEELSRMVQRTGRRTVPQIFIGTCHVGGFDDLVAIQVSGELDVLLGA